MSGPVVVEPDPARVAAVDNWLHARPEDLIVPEDAPWRVRTRQVRRRRPVRFTAAELDGMTFAPVQWAIPGVLPEGLTVLAGKPKVGKSWLALGYGLTVAETGSEVLYLALEDPPRRLQVRMRMVLRGREAPRSLHFETEWPKLDHGGFDALSGWLDRHRSTRLVIVDTIAKVRPLRGASEDQYLGDYAVWGPLQGLALDRPGLSITTVHHQRKGAADDIADTILGSQGVTGVADTLLVLVKARGQADGELHLISRDVEDSERALRFEGGVWTDMGDAEAFRMSDERAALVNLLQVEGPQTVREVGAKLGLVYHAAYHRLTRAVEAGVVKRDGDRFLV